MTHFADVHYYFLMRYQGERQVFAAVTCHKAISAPDFVIPLQLQYARLAELQGSGMCFIPAASFISRVIFIKNGRLPVIGNKMSMFVSPNLDHKHEL